MVLNTATDDVTMIGAQLRRHGYGTTNAADGDLSCPPTLTFTLTLTSGVKVTLAPTQLLGCVAAWKFYSVMSETTRDDMNVF